MSVEERIIFEEQPKIFGFWDYFTVAGGTILLLFSVYGYLYMSESDFPKWSIAGVGILGLSLTLQTIIRRPDTSRAIIDYTMRKVVLEKRSVFGDSSKGYDFSEIRGFRVKQDFDPDKPDGWHIEMELKVGEPLELVHSFNRAPEQLEEIVQSVNQRLQRLSS
jgi:hypothetical protein